MTTSRARLTRLQRRPSHPMTPGAITRLQREPSDHVTSADNARSSPGSGELEGETAKRSRVTMSRARPTQRDQRRTTSPIIPTPESPQSPTHALPCRCKYLPNGTDPLINECPLHRKPRKICLSKTQNHDRSLDSRIPHRRSTRRHLPSGKPLLTMAIPQ